MSLCVYCISRLRFSDIGGMAEVDEQRVYIKFCVRLDKTGSETCVEKCRKFDTIEEIQEESQRVLDTIPNRDFQGWFQAWQKSWDRCIRAKEEYFEGDGGI
jgi:hypothetical protein